MDGVNDLRNTVPGCPFEQKVTGITHENSEVLDSNAVGTVVNRKSL